MHAAVSCSMNSAVSCSQLKGDSRATLPWAVCEPTAFVSTRSPNAKLRSLCTVLFVVLWFYIYINIFVSIKWSFSIRKEHIISSTKHTLSFEVQVADEWAAVLGTLYLVRAETAILLLQVGSRHSGALVRTSSLCYATFCFVFPFPFFFSSFPRSSPPGPAKKTKENSRGGTIATGAVCWRIISYSVLE